MRARPPLLVLLGALGAATACAPDESSVGAVFRAESGLAAEYFDGRNLQQPSGTYRDANIDFTGFELNERVRSRGHAARTLSIRWTGQIWLPRAEPYTLSFELRGRVRLWIDDAPIIDDWVDGWGLRQARARAAVPGGAWRDLRIEWDQLAGPMDAILRYETPSQPAAAVPPAALRTLEPDLDAANTWDLPLTSVTGVAASFGGTVVGGVSSQDGLFWDAWLVPCDGGSPRQLAPIGTTLVTVDAAGAVWTTIAGIDDAGKVAYEIRLSPADGSASVPLSPQLPPGFAAEHAAPDGHGGWLVAGSEARADGAEQGAMFAVAADGSATAIR